MADRFFRRLPATRHRDFRALWGGTTCSSISLWTLLLGNAWIVYASTVLNFVMAFLGLAYSLYPYIVIDRITVWQAAASPGSLVVSFIGVAITLPVIVAYTIYMYRVFWGPAEALSYSKGTSDY